MELSLPLVNFSKYVGAGNDFLLVDDRRGGFPCLPHLIAKLCHRQQGVGADGVILLTEASGADFGFRIFNADGSEAEMCGNGVRCLARFLEELGLSASTFTLETKERLLFVKIGKEIAVEMGEARDLMLELEPNLHFVNTGVPHAVTFVPDVNEVDVAEDGRKLRFHPRFQPKGTNASFASLKPDGSVAVRTYERGVEAETLACGTAATAVALIAAQLYDLPSPVRVHTRSEAILSVSFEKGFSRLTLTGPAHLVFRGVVNLALIDQLQYSS